MTKYYFKPILRLQKPKYSSFLINHVLQGVSIKIYKGGKEKKYIYNLVGWDFGLWSVQYHMCKLDVQPINTVISFPFFFFTFWSGTFSKLAET